MRVPLFVFILLNTACISQVIGNKAKIGKDTTRIYLYGAVRDFQTKETIPFASYLLFTTDTGSIWHGSVRRGMSDNLGNFKIDITTLVDSTKILTIRSKYINYALTHIMLKGKITKSIPVDIEAIYGNGDYYVYYKVLSKKSKLKPQKEIKKVYRSEY